MIVGSMSFSSGFSSSKAPNSSLSSSSIERAGSSCTGSSSLTGSNTGSYFSFGSTTSGSGSIFSTATPRELFLLSITLSQLKSTSSVFRGCADGNPSRFQSKDTVSLPLDAGFGGSVVFRISSVLLSASILKGGLKTTSSYLARLASLTAAPQ